MWVAIAAIGFVAVVTLVNRTDQMWTNIYVLTICLVAGALFTVVNRFEPNRLLAFVLTLLIFGIGAAAVARQLAASP
jgi:hypothetical protein